MTESKTAEEWASNFWSLNDQDEKTLALWFRCAQDQARREAIEKCLAIAEWEADKSGDRPEYFDQFKMNEPKPWLDTWKSCSGVIANRIRGLLEVS